MEGGGWRVMHSCEKSVHGPVVETFERDARVLVLSGALLKRTPFQAYAPSCSQTLYSFEPSFPTVVMPALVAPLGSMVSALFREAVDWSCGSIVVAS